MEIIEAAGLRLGVTDEGAGKPVLLLHPFPLDGTVLDGQVEVLTRERRVIRVDFPGFGNSPAPEGAVSIEGYARAVREALAKKKILRAEGIGLSLGSYVLIELSRQAPALFDRLVLVSSRATAASPEVRAEREAMAKRAEAEGVAWVAASWPPLLLKPAAELAALRTVEKIINRATPQGIAAGARALANRPDQSAAARGVTAKTMVVHGGEDRLTPLAEAAALAQLIPQSRLEVIPGAGHVPHLDEADRFNRSVVSFLGD
jgi:pimeloyl-ACP methyl ester carboxylesterase